ncbi:unnamed protein product [Rhizophagus irregularis]|nr:unnamed protein product [Rhizophagus irregularis]CAB5387836.1 unnamed protein product [Rhizophagus irregularis]
MTKHKSKRNFVQLKVVQSLKKKKARTRKHEICNCNLCKGAKVDPHTKALHMKKGERDLGTRNLIELTDVQIEEGTYSYIDVAVSDGPMEIDARNNEHVNEDESDSEYDNDEQDEQTVNFDASDIEDHFDNIPITSINQEFAWIIYANFAK